MTLSKYQKHSRLMVAHNFLTLQHKPDIKLSKSLYIILLSKQKKGGVQMQTQCFVKWQKDEADNFYRDGTILQYGKSWNLLGNVILLNPGSAKPMDEKPMNAYLKEHDPYFDDDGEYFAFNVDPLMCSLVSLFKQKYPDGGTIRIYNLFNLKNAKSGDALEIFANISKNRYAMTPIERVDFHNAPVIIVTGKNVHAHPKLEEQLQRFIAKTPAENLYAITRKDKSTFLIEKAVPNENGLVENYHPSYSCKYGNTTKWS